MTRSRTFRGWLLLGLGLLLGASPERALGIPAPGMEALAAAGCACAGQVDALRALRDRIAASPSVAEARELALDETRLASAALHRASGLLPWSDGLTSARKRLEAFELRVGLAATPQGVAGELSKLVRLDSPRADTDVECDYTTLEIIAIVLGFILGIIPGIILLLLLC